MTDFLGFSGLAAEPAAATMLGLEGRAARQLTALATSLLQDAGNDAALAESMFVEQVIADDELALQVARDAARYHVRRAEFYGRRRIQSAPSPDASRDIAGLKAYVGMKRWLDEYTLTGARVRLGDATHKELHVSIRLHDALSASNGKQAEFLRRVMARVRDGAAVRDCLTDAEIEQLWEAN
jgi:hypothetical protein